MKAEAGRGYDLVFLGVSRPSARSHRLLRSLLATGSEVVLVRMGPGVRPFERIVLPVTGTAPSRAATELGFLHARETGARVHLVHVLDPAAAPRCHILTSRHAARAILDVAEDDGADLVLLGAEPRYVGRRAYFGPTADRILAQARCAVAVYAGGVRPELRAAVPEPAPEAAHPGAERSADGEAAPLH